MPLPSFQPPSAREIEDLATRALDWIDAYRAHSMDPDFDQEPGARDGSFDLAAATLRFCARSAAALRDPDLLPVICDVVSVLTEYSHLPSHADEALYALEVLVKHSDSPEVADVLLDSGSERVRKALARGLDPEHPEARAMLERLANDGASSVREAARDALARVGGVAWWRGVFRSDPSVGMSPEEAARAKARFEAVVAIMNARDALSGTNLKKLRALLAKLPDRAARDVGETLVRGAERGEPELVALTGDLIARPGGAAWAVEVATGAEGMRPYARETLVKDALARVPRSRRQEACDALLALVVAAPRETWDDTSPAMIAARVLPSTWTRRGDLSPLLDRVLLEAESRGNTLVFHLLTQTIALRHPARASILPRVLDALERTLPDEWARIEETCLKVASFAPAARRRALATRLLDVGRDASKRWAIRELVGSTTPPRRAARRRRIDALAVDARTRSTMLGDVDLCTLALPCFREALREGTLSARHVVTVFEAIDRLYGGLPEEGEYDYLHAPSKLISSAVRAQRCEKARAERRAAMEDLLGPPEARGPIREDEWALWRRVRPSALTDDLTWREVEGVLKALPPGAIAPEDRIAFEHAMRLWRNGSHRHLPRVLLSQFRRHADPWLLPCYDEIATHATDEDVQKAARAGHRYAREILGLEPIQAVADAPIANDRGDDDDDDMAWMDRDD